MSMVRMFSIQCDKCLNMVDGAEWYSSVAKERAIEEGFKLRNNEAICEDCWEKGERF